VTIYESQSTDIIIRRDVCVTAMVSNFFAKNISLDEEYSGILNELFPEVVKDHPLSYRRDKSVMNSYGPIQGVELHLNVPEEV